uniref:Zinc finger domain containing protein n=1 Tax=Haemonchus contortus TaxID=6289 RepID=A0A7I4YWJ7_HAECO
GHDRSNTVIVLPYAGYLLPFSHRMTHTMSLSDFWVHRLISTTTPSPVPSCSSVASEDTSKLSDAPPLLKPEAVKPNIDFGALQMLQMQLMWQPQIMQNFLAMISIDQDQRQQKQKEQFKEITATNAVNPRKRPPSVVSETKKTKQRKLGDDSVNASPVSGMFIKIFSCPANLASHRRWHRPKEQAEAFRCMACSSAFSTRKEFKAHSCREPLRPSMPFDSLFTGLLSSPLAPLKLEMH